MKEILKPNLAKLFTTLLLGFLVFLIGIFILKNPIFLKTGCVPNPECPTCLICFSWGFPGIINLYSLPILIILYGISSVIYFMAKKNNKQYMLDKLTLIFFLISMFFIFGYFYYLNWAGRCRAFPTDYSLSNPFQGPQELRCPQFFNPFSWSEFERDWERIK
ncbi:hypothetical protein HYU89_04405 [Candidatus Collierbacteria bacterium]|nr:hypothetical protein [Candidatus Collierbacteria bacterium]